MSMTNAHSTPIHLDSLPSLLYIPMETNQLEIADREQGGLAICKVLGLNSILQFL